MKTKDFMGKGVLSWHANERRTDRYGSIMLMAEGINSCSNKDKAAELKYMPPEGCYGQLSVLVTQNRKSTHIGDFFRGVFPTQPEIGEEIILGKGLIFYNTDPDLPYTFIGLYPLDERETDWLDIHSLYRSHEQSVELYFEEKTISDMNQALKNQT